MKPTAFIQQYKRALWRALLILMLLVGVRGYLFWSHIQAPLALTEPYFLDVSSGSSLHSILREVKAAGLLENTEDLLVYARLRGIAGKLKAGEYELVAGVTASRLLTLLASGQVTYHQVRLGEGWTLQQALTEIQAHPAIIATLDPNNRLALQQTFATDRYPEGLFFPETYNFTRGTTDLDILMRARLLMDEILTKAWQARDSGLPFENAFESLIMASIIEKETALVSEQAQIAGVFIRRLQRNMRLQTDPTVIYGLGMDFDGNLTRADLRQDTPWNTYTRSGLPPTPIALPSQSAIEASMHPDQSQNLYFVARGDGSHQFSATLQEHNRAVRQYQLANPVP